MYQGKPRVSGHVQGLFSANQNMFSLWRLFNKMRAIEKLFPKNFSSNYSDQIMAFCFHIPTKIGKKNDFLA
jgi:dihydroorotase